MTWGLGFPKAMHTIDLLRGEGIPAKATFGTICLVAVIVVVPILAGSVMAGLYLQNREVIGIDQQAISRAEQTIDTYKADVAEKQKKEQQQAAINAKLAEVKSCLGEYVQWSPVLMDLAKNMPEGMIMSRVEAQVRQSRQTVYKENEPERPINITINKRVLVLELAGRTAGNYDGVVRTYGDSLKNSPVVGPKLENISYSQKPGEIGDAATIIHTMELAFKTGS